MRYTRLSAALPERLARSLEAGTLEPGLRIRRRSALKFAAHTNRRSEASLGGVDSVKADLLIEPLGGPGYDLEKLGALI
jgi:hypothetical protein